MIKKIMALLLLSSLGCASSPEVVYKEANDKVVMLHMINKKGDGVCSGAFINSTGDILTCVHCFPEIPKKIFVKMANGEVKLGYLVRLSAIRDLALVSIESKDRPYFRIGREVQIGQQVFAFGSPLGLRNSMSVGWVENKFDFDKRLIMHSSFANPGNSGGPLVDTHGRLVGINEATLMVNILFPAQGLFLAIDRDTVRDWLEDRR